MLLISDYGICSIYLHHVMTMAEWKPVNFMLTSFNSSFNFSPEYFEQFLEANLRFIIRQFRVYHCPDQMVVTKIRCYTVAYEGRIFGVNMVQIGLFFNAINYA